jgi:hypothetical protein
LSFGVDATFEVKMKGQLGPDRSSSGHGGGVLWHHLSFRHFPQTSHMKDLIIQLSSTLADFLHQYDKEQMLVPGSQVTVNWTSLAGFFDSLNIKLHDIKGFQTRFKDIVQFDRTGTVKPSITVAQLISLLERDVDDNRNSLLENLYDKLEMLEYNQVDSSQPKVTSVRMIVEYIYICVFTF